MHLKLFKGFITIITLSLLTSCQFYKSQGRKNFESDSEGRLQKSTFGSGLTENTVANDDNKDIEPTYCWVQFKTESFPANTDHKKIISIKAIDQFQIEICEGA
jgi:hypothetical protein